MTILLRAHIREWRRMFTQWPVFSVLIGAAAIYAVFYPQPYLNEALRDVPIAVVDLDGTTASRDLIRRVDASADVAVAAIPPDADSARRLIYQRNIHGLVLIPKGFEREISHGRPSPIALYADAGYFLVYQRISNGVTGAARAMGAEVETARLVAGGIDPSVAETIVEPVRFTAVPLFNPQGGYATYLLPAAFVLILQQLLMIGAGLLGAIPDEKGEEPRGFGDVVSILLGRMSAQLILECPIFALYLIVLPHVYGVPRLGDPLDLAFAALPFAIAVCALGQIAATVFRGPAVVQLVLATMGLPFFFLSGFGWPASMMPEFVQAAARLVPSTAAIDALVRIGQLGATLPLVAATVSTLWGLAGGYLVLAIVLTARRSLGRR